MALMVTEVQRVPQDLRVLLETQASQEHQASQAHQELMD